MDLLLQLIERAELDITKLALVEVTKPFLDFVKQLEDQQAEEVSSFLVVAARLMQIKSEALLPRPPEREPGEEDPGDELVRQLILYKRYKEIAEVLDGRATSGLRTYLRLEAPYKMETKVTLEDIDIQKLFKAAKEVFKLYEDERSVGTVIKAARVTIREKIKRITELLVLEGSTSFKELLGEKYTKLDIVITFLALLELVKRYRVQVTQETLFSDINIETSDGWETGEDIDIEFIE
ncbi:MAG: segregation/condensation protein A [Anaerolineales bacterium]